MCLIVVYFGVFRLIVVCVLYVVKVVLCLLLFVVCCLLSIACYVVLIVRGLFVVC